MSKVQPIRDLDKIAEIEDMLFGIGTPRGYRMFVMFEVGIYLGLRIGDMLKLRVGDIRGKETFTFMPEKEDVYHNRKTGEVVESHKPKVLTLTIAGELRNTIRKMYDGMPDDALLFPSRKTRNGKTKAISYKSAYMDMKMIAAAARLDYNVATHTLRKTFGYQIYQQTHDAAWLAEWYGHSNPAYTLIYIGIDEDNKRAVTNNMPYKNRSRFDYRSMPENRFFGPKGKMCEI